MSKRTKSSITNLKHYFGCSLSFVSISYNISHLYFAQVMVDAKSCTGAQMRVLKVQTAEAALGHWVWQSQSLGSRSSILHF